MGLYPIYLCSSVDKSLGSFLMVKSLPPPTKVGSHGGMAERLKAHVLKTCLVKANVGSNPTPSALQFGYKPCARRKC
ncbi:MAG: hypothetical protein RL275_388 [Chloroflexota bacterium]